MITYCTNIHPGENLAETFANLKNYLPEVKRAVQPESAFPVGLRLSHQAAMEADPASAVRIRDWCEENGFFIPTLNGFPYGDFHRVSVKEQVYLPNWRSPDRAAYTQRLADLLDFWLPAGRTGSISTVPAAFKGHWTETDYPLVRGNLLSALEHLHGLQEKSGKRIILALEPEPGCLLETTSEAVLFFERLALPEYLKGLLGICLDCCHQAVEFEDPLETLDRLKEAGMAIGKVQISSALRLQHFDPDFLHRFADPRYLHQVVVRRNGALFRYDDLPQALAARTVESGEEEWRIHFHVPVFWDMLGSHGTTRFFIEALLPRLDPGILLEVETYTWEVLPPEMQLPTVTQSIIRELLWLRNQIHETDGCAQRGRPDPIPDRGSYPAPEIVSSRQY